MSKVDVSWGQIIFFEVKPGRSYHAVEEVICGEGRQRLGVSGWYVLSPSGRTIRRLIADDVGFTVLSKERRDTTQTRSTRRKI